jgi:hypothetical protein
MKRSPAAAVFTSVALLLLACGRDVPSDEPGGGAPVDGTPAPDSATPDASAAAPPHDWLIVPDTRIGPVRRGTTERALTQLLGEERVVRREAHIGEGFCATGSRLYPGTPEELEVLWSDSTYSEPAAARVAGARSRWRTSRGVGVGTSLSELERVAGAPVEFGGFGWDYGGGATWTESTAEASGTIVLELAPNPDSSSVVASDPRYSEILGERTVRSDHPLIRRLDVRVERLTVRLGRWPTEHECALP